MRDMPRPRKPYTQREKTRHGKWVWYFRRPGGKHIRLRGEYESPEWLADYEAAISGAPAPMPAATGTLRWLVERYKSSALYAGLSPETQRFRSSILKRVVETGGDLKLHQITKTMIAEGRDRRAKTPFAAVNYVKVMGQLFSFAVKSGYMKENPAAHVDRPAPSTSGHHVWTVEEVRKYHAKFPIGTRARLAMDLLLYTGVRRGDVVLLGHQHIRDDVLMYRSSKTGVEVVIPVLPELRASIDATETGDLALLVTSKGEPWKKESFGNWFADQCRAAGVPGRAHGLRKAGATIAAEHGATDHQLMAIFGWTNPSQAAVYTRTASRAILARQATAMLVPDALKLDEAGTSIPAPHDPVRASERKAK